MKFKAMEKKYNNGYSDLIGTDRWLYSFDNYISLYEIKELKDMNEPIKGNELTFFSYPDGNSYTPYELEYGIYYEHIIFIEGIIYFIRADFNIDQIYIIKYIPDKNVLTEIAHFDKKDLNLYNIRLAKYPLMLISVDKECNVYYPEKLTIKMDARDSFIVRDGDAFYFNRWVEEGIDENDNVTPDYKYYDNIVKVSKSGEVLSIEKGNLSEMPNGEMWIL